jgi:urease accessory protein
VRHEVPLFLAGPKSNRVSTTTFWPALQKKRHFMPHSKRPTSMNLHLLQLGDSALPVGGYSHSWGLEAAVHRGLVRDAATLERWVRCWLTLGVGPTEGVVVAAVCREAARDDHQTAVAACDLLTATLTPPTLRHASREMGEQLLRLAEVWPWAAQRVERLRHAVRGLASFGGWHHAGVFASLAQAGGAQPADAVAVYLHQAALGVIGAGVRAIPIGHTHGQQILAILQESISSLAGDLAGRDLDTAGSFAPAYEVLCHAQAGLYTRLFRS